MYNRSLLYKWTFIICLFIVRYYSPYFRSLPQKIVGNHTYLSKMQEIGLLKHFRAKNSDHLQGKRNVRYYFDSSEFMFDSALNRICPVGRFFNKTIFALRGQWCQKSL